MSALPKQVDYHRNIQHAAKYKFLRVPLANNASGSLGTIGPNDAIATGLTNQSVLLQWKIPSGVTINLSRSMISYTMWVGKQGAGKYSWVADDCFQIAQQLTLTTAPGINIADIPFAGRYTKIADKYFTRFDDFKCRSRADLQYPCDELIADNPINTVIGNEANIPAENIYGVAPTVDLDVGFVNYTEPKYYKISGNDGILNLAKYQRLGDVGMGTLFEQDKDLYFGEDVYLNLTTAPVDTIGFSSVKNDQIDTPAALLDNSMVLQNIILHLAVEDNVVLADSVRAKYESSGIDLRTDFIFGLRNICSGPISNVNVLIPQQSNAKLKRVINCIYSGSDQLNNAYNAHNLNGEKIQTYQSFIDSQPLQNNILSCLMSTGKILGNTDYRDNEKFIVDSVIQGVPMYQYNWAHIDDFSGDDSIHDNEHLQNMDNGLDLNVSRNYLMAMTTPNATANNSLALYSFCVLSKTLHIGKDGIFFR